MTPPRGNARNGRTPQRPTTPPEPPPPPGPAGASQPAAVAAGIADTVLRKAAAFDDLTGWLTERSGAAQGTAAMGPEWVVSNLKSKLASLIEDGRDFRAGRRKPAWMRRSGW